MRQVMLAVRELNIDRLPESSRNWINETLVYTHGYGITMNPVNGFTPEGLPDLILSNMPVQSTVASIQVTRPEIYFGELTNTDVYVNTRQKEFNYPQGETNNVTSYEGKGGIVLGGFFRRLLIALDRGDLTRLPFSDDITAESRLLMRRNIRERVAAIAPFLTFDPDPYIVLGADGRLIWMMDGFTTSDSYPYARHYRLDRELVNYIRNSVKIAVDAYDGTVDLLRVRRRGSDHRRVSRRSFPRSSRTGRDMPADLRAHVRYPELMLQMQAAVYGLYHISEPAIFYNREDVWSVAAEVGMNDRREQAAQVMEPNFVLMKLPGEDQHGVRRDAAVHAAQPQQPDRLDCRAERRPALRVGARVQLSEEPAGGRPAADRSAHRSESAAVGAALALEPAGLERPARQPDRHPGRSRAALRRADLSAGRAQPDAGAADRRARAAGQAGVRSDVRSGAVSAVRRTRRRHDASRHRGMPATAHGGCRHRRAAHRRRRRMRRSSLRRRAILPNTSD